MGHQEIANLLLSQRDVDADARDDYGRSPLSLAAEEGDEALVRLLLKRENVEVESKDK
jgi:ankyrin repeat protein